MHNMNKRRRTIILGFDFLRKQKKRKHYWFLGLIILLVLSSCKEGNDGNNQINSFQSTNRIDRGIGTNTDQPDSATTDSTPQLERNPINFQTITDLVQHCAIETDKIILPDESELIGFVQNGENYSLGKLTNDFSWEVIPGTNHAFPLDISPDANWLAFLASQSSTYDSLKLINAKAELIERDLGFSISSDSRWLFNDFLVLIPDDVSRTKYLFNPFSNETRSFPDYPDESIDDRFDNVFWFNPQGTQIVFLESDEKYRSFYSSEKYVIYDFEANVTLETGLSWVTSLPAWSPNGNYLAVVSLGPLQVMRQIPSQEIFFIDMTTGTSYQISNFFELFEGVSIHNLTWSPDGRYLLFELDVIDNSLPEIFEPSPYIIDLQEQQVIDLCLDNIDDIAGSTYLWDPNSQLVSWHGRSGDIYILDVTSADLLHQSSPEAGLIGWLAKN